MTMKTAAVFLTCAYLACAAAGEESRLRAVPQPRPRLDPNSNVAVAASDAAAPSAAKSATVAMSPYIVRETASTQPSPQIPIPQGAPARSGSRVTNAAQTGVLLERNGGKFKTAVLAHGEQDAGGFGRIRIGYRISW